MTDDEFKARFIAAFEAQAKDVSPEHAALIGAAPELLAMVKRYASECGYCDGNGFAEEIEGNQIVHVPCRECADTRAVIAKAEVLRG